MVHAGDSSNRIWHSTWDGTNWTPNTRIPNQTSQAPSTIASHDGLLHLLHIGDTSNRIFHSTLDLAWRPNVAVPHQTSKSQPAMVNHAGVLHMVHAGDSSNRIWHSRCFVNQTTNIMITGYWPPTNHMIAQFSRDPELNPDGWKGRNWRDHGFDIHAFFPDLDNPNADPLGTGDFTVNYPDTTADWARITAVIQPVAIITFSRGDNDRSWEIEARQRNRSLWLTDHYTGQPDPEPPDLGVPPETIRLSTLPMESIRQRVDAAGLGLNVYIDDSSSDLGGGFLSEFIAYLGVWYQSLNRGVDSWGRCLAAGHVHVGVQVPLADATIAAEETIEALIDHIDDMIDGLAGRFIANRRTHETHSYLRPCRWVRLMAPSNRWIVDDKPPHYNWCDFCFPALADG